MDPTIRSGCLPVVRVEAGHLIVIDRCSDPTEVRTKNNVKFSFNHSRREIMSDEFFRRKLQDNTDGHQRIGDNMRW